MSDLIRAAVAQTLVELIQSDPSVAVALRAQLEAANRRQAKVVEMRRVAVTDPMFLRGMPAVAKLIGLPKSTLCKMIADVGKWRSSSTPGAPPAFPAPAAATGNAKLYDSATIREWIGAALSAGYLDPSRPCATPFGSGIVEDLHHPS